MPQTGRPLPRSPVEGPPRDHRPRPGRERLAGVDYAKAAAITAVVFAHAGVPVRWEQYGFWDLLLRTRWVAFHVPVFLMVSGLLYHQTTPVTLRDTGRRLLRIIVPYVIASLAIHLSGVRSFMPGNEADAATILWEIATGRTLGIYYYVFLIVLLTPLAWPLSRLDRRAVVVLFVASYVYAIASAADPGLRLAGGWLSSVRNPFNYSLTYFLAGWLVAAYSAELGQALRRFRPAVIAAVLVPIGVYALYQYGPMTGFELAWPKTRALPSVLRSGYALAIGAAIAVVTLGRRIPRLVRFLSETSYTTFLYHRLFMWLVLETTLPWHPAARILTLVAVGFAVPSLLCVASRPLLGRRSKWLIGS